MSGCGSGRGVGSSSPVMGNGKYKQTGNLACPYRSKAHGGRLCRTQCHGSKSSSKMNTAIISRSCYCLSLHQHIERQNDYFSKQ